MPNAHKLTQEAFDHLLDWLGPDKETAGKQYQRIHTKLKQLFSFKGCDCPEDLADSAMDRVADKVDRLPPFVPEEQGRVFYGFAKFVYLEYLARKRVVPSPTVPEDDDGRIEEQHECLEICLSRLAEPDRLLLMRYYESGMGGKVQHRQTLAKDLQIAPNALRIRICRWRAVVRNCVLHCLETQQSHRLQS
jgi:hypothetical protein